MIKKLEILHGIVKPVHTLVSFQEETLSEIIKSVEDLHMEC